MTYLEQLVDLERFTGLTTAEIAAAKTDLHMSTCRDPIWQCEMCAGFVKVIRRIVAAVGPVLLEEVSEP
jgi:hypothetical protein